MNTTIFRRNINRVKTRVKIFKFITTIINWPNSINNGNSTINWKVILSPNIVSCKNYISFFTITKRLLYNNWSCKIAFSNLYIWYCKYTWVWWHTYLSNINRVNICCCYRKHITILIVCTIKTILISTWYTTYYYFSISITIYISRWYIRI